MRTDGLWASTRLESKFKRGNLPIEQLCELISIRSTIIIVTVINTPSCFDTRTIILSFSDGSSWAKYKVVQIWPGLTVCKEVTVRPGHIWTTLYVNCSTRQACPTTARIAPPFSSLKKSFAFADVGVLRSLRDVLAVCTRHTGQSAVWQWRQTNREASRGSLNTKWQAMTATQGKESSHLKPARTTASFMCVVRPSISGTLTAHVHNTDLRQYTHTHTHTNTHTQHINLWFWYFVYRAC